MAFRRRLAAIWFADIVDYTKLSASNEPRALELVDVFQRAARRSVGSYGGRLVKFLGDGALAEFQSSQAAISSAHALLTAFEKDAAAAGLPAGHLRIGVHSGEIVESEDGDLYGDGVNVASRIAGKAGENQIVVSSDVCRQLRQLPDFRFESLGPVDLKGLGEVEVSRVVGLPAPGPEAASDQDRRDHPGPGRRATYIAFGVSVVIVAAILDLVTQDSNRPPAVRANPELASTAVAVLPFQISGNAPMEWREGMVDLVSTNLDGVGGLRAIDSRTVLRRWEDARGEDPGNGEGVREALEVGRTAGARFAVVGRAVGLGARVRLVADIYDLDSGRRIGQSQTEGPSGSVFLLVDRLSIDILGHLQEDGSDETLQVSLALVTTDSLEALKAFLQGEVFFRESAWAPAYESYQRAVKIDSTFALALLRLGQTAGWGAQESPLPFYERAIRHADRMRTRDQLILQGALSREAGRLDAIEVLENATRLYPDDAMAWLELGESYYHLGAQGLRSRHASDTAFERSLTIDRTLSPAYIHMIENAFGLHADSARAAGLVAAFVEIAPETREARLYPLGLNLVFGDAAARRRAREATDALPLPEARFVARNLLWHPRSLALQESLFARHHQSQSLAITQLRRGRLEAALQTIEDPSISPEWRAVLLYGAHAWDYPIPMSRLDPLLARGVEAEPVLLFLRGAYALDRGRKDIHDDAIRSLEAASEAWKRDGKPQQADFAMGAAAALRGYSDLRALRTERAASMLESARLQATGLADPREGVNGIIRRWLVVAAEGRRDPRVSEYLGSFWGLGDAFASVASHELAASYEQLGNQVAARDASADFAIAWAEADTILRNSMELQSNDR